MNPELKLLAKFLQERGLSLSFAALQLGVSKSTLSKILHSKTPLSPESSDDLMRRITDWMQNILEHEHSIYAQIHPLIITLHASSGRFVLRQLTSDL